MRAFVADGPEAEQLALIDHLVELSSRMHGHLCPGQVVGVRMAITGLAMLGYPCPLPYPEIKNIVGFVEIERCLADAIATATGLRFGRGSLKLVNLGLLAASFMEISSGKAVRVVSKDSARELAREYAPDARTEREAQLMAYRVMPTHELLDVQWVRIHIEEHELPGARPPKVPCSRCGVLVRSGQVRVVDGQKLCAVCAGQAYFEPLG